MKKIFLYLSIFTFFFYIGCAPSNYQTTPFISKSYYTSSFPTQNVSQELERIQQSVQRITSTVIYDTYFIGNQNLTAQNIRNSNLEILASKKVTTDQSKGGTAISILQNKKHAVLITALHVVSFPDTVISYKKGENIPDNKFVKSVAVKKNLQSYLIQNSRIVNIMTLAKDAASDLALVEVNREKNEIDTPPLPIKIGNTRNLRVGSFLYILGFPFGSPMVTRGIVSAPNYDKQGSFLTDALFNHGISGGLVIASRTNFNNFDWVGMAITTSATLQKFLIPDPAKEEKYKNFEAYTDTAFVSQKRIINYGITNVTPINQIVTFLLGNEDKLNKLGLSFTNLNGQ